MCETPVMRVYSPWNRYYGPSGKPPPEKGVCLGLLPLVEIACGICALTVEGIHVHDCSLNYIMPNLFFLLGEMVLHARIVASIKSISLSDTLPR